MVGSIRNQSKLTRLFRTELEIFNIQSEQQQTPSPLVRRPCEQLAGELRICSSWRTELDIFNIQLKQQQQGDDNLRFANLHSCPPSVRTACVRNSISEQQQQRDDNLTTRQSLVSAVRANCLRTELDIRTAATKRRQPYDSPITRVRRPCKLLANRKFALRGRDSFRSSEPPKKLMH